MVKERKFYDLLEVPEDASDSDLKKAYRKKCVSLHSSFHLPLGSSVTVQRVSTDPAVALRVVEGRPMLIVFHQGITTTPGQGRRSRVVQGGDPRVRRRPRFTTPNRRADLAIAASPRYEVLSDAQKRSIYDTRGEAGLNDSGGMGGMDPQVRVIVLWRVLQ